MVALTFGASRIAAKAGAKSTAPVASRKTWFAHFMDALAESRLRAAEREILKHSHLCSSNANVRNTPFGGW